MKIKSLSITLMTCFSHTGAHTSHSLPALIPLALFFCSFLPPAFCLPLHPSIHLISLIFSIFPPCFPHIILSSTYISLFPYLFFHHFFCLYFIFFYSPSLSPSSLLPHFIFPFLYFLLSSLILPSALPSNRKGFLKRHHRGAMFHSLKRNIWSRILYQFYYFHNSDLESLYYTIILHFYYIIILLYYSQSSFHMITLSRRLSSGSFILKCYLKPCVGACVYVCMCK